MRKKENIPVVTYIYAKPKTEEDRVLQEAMVSNAYDILFNATAEWLAKQKDSEDDPKGIRENSCL